MLKNQQEYTANSIVFVCRISMLFYLYYYQIVINSIKDEFPFFPRYKTKLCFQTVFILQEIQAFTSSMLDLHYFYVTFANFHCKSYRKNVCTMCRYFDSKNQIQSHYLLHEEMMCHLQVQIPANIPDLQ